ncbi:uncharacterized protein LOC100905697 [Galendromus occidentalis]|uniref:Uncharacterized protein LOC100905697 n=1 Tax=Galendromus occidentalis TaxID=34638 RepID=A0AAJ6QYI2_9ACAR|nr:uncharacterized protein LOC100905697 [Galendromus occidentalis]
MEYGLVCLSLLVAHSAAASLHPLDVTLESSGGTPTGFASGDHAIASAASLSVLTNKESCTFNDWFSQLSIWIQIPLAIGIFLGFMSLLVVILNIFLFSLTVCCGFCFACFISDGYIPV